MLAKRPGLPVKARAFIASPPRLLFDSRGPEWTVGEEHFLVVCRDATLVEHCLHSLQRGDIVCVEGRLVVTLLNSEGTDVPLAEILAHKVIVLDEEKKSYLARHR